MSNHRFLQNDNEAVDDGMALSDIILAIGVFILMVGIGASCKVALLRKMLKSPKALKAAAVGVCCQFIFMPVVAYLLTLIFRMEGYTAMGVALTAAMPGGNSSNIFTLWGKGILELSVFMTIFSTFVAFGLTPLWLFIFTKAVDGVETNSFAFVDMVITFALLVVPLAIGFGLNFIPCLERINFEKPLSVFAVLLFIAVIALLFVEYPDVLQLYTTWEIVVSAGIFFPIAAGLSYCVMTLLKFRPSVRRTVVFEVGFQNLALGLAIGKQSVQDPSDQNKTLPFPMLYALFMYFWGFIFCPLMRYQKRRNDKKGVEDADPDFFIEEKSASVPSEPQEGIEVKDVENNFETETADVVVDAEQHL